MDGRGVVDALTAPWDRGFPQEEWELLQDGNYRRYRELQGVRLSYWG